MKPNICIKGLALKKRAYFMMNISESLQAMKKY